MWYRSRKPHICYAYYSSSANRFFRLRAYTPKPKPFTELHALLAEIYDSHQCCQHSNISLKIDNNKSSFGGLRGLFQKTLKTLLKNKNYNAQDITQYTNLVNATYDSLQKAITPEIVQQIPTQLTQALDDNIFLFSGLKTHAQLTEASKLLKDNNGNIKSQEQFTREFTQLYSKYNQQYLQAEYAFAQQSVLSASRWSQFDDDNDFMLQYRTAGDERVRSAHQSLHNTTLPKNDPFWQSFTPPNGWRCRCTVVQVNADKYQKSNPEQAIKLGEQATLTPNKNGINTSDIFRFNPGTDKIVFPKNHPYTRVKDADKAITKLQENKHQQPKKNMPNDLINNTIDELGKKHKWFERGFSKIIISKNKNINGATDMNGLIGLSKERFRLVSESIADIKKGKQITEKHADAIATLWHEITHNRSKVGNEKITKKQIAFMECSNEFVARNTLPQFYKALGSKIQHKQFLESRQSSGYNNQVLTYRNLIKYTGADFDKVAQKVEHGLLNTSYKKQKQVLVDGLIHGGAINPNTQKSFTKTDINKLVNWTNDRNKCYNDDDFNTLLKNENK